MLKRLERKLQRFERERHRIEYQLIGKHGLSYTLRWEEFSRDVDSACFIAYYTARGNLRSVFTNGAQTRAFDEVSAMLLDRCRDQLATNSWTIAHAYSGQEVLGYLSPAR